MKRVTLKSIGLAIIVGSIFLASMNFAAKYFYLIYIAFFLLVLTFRKLIVNRVLIFYICFGLARAYFAWEADSNVLSILRQFAFVLSYIIGYNIILYFGRKKPIENSENSLIVIVYALAGGSFVHLVLNLIINFGTVGTRNTIDIWSKSVMAATGQAALACLTIGIAVASLIKPVKSIHRIFAIVVLTAIFYYNLTISSRTIIVMTAIVAIFGVIFLMTSNLEKRKKCVAIIVLATIVVLLIIIYMTNILNIQSVISGSNMYDRMVNQRDSFFDQSSRLRAKLYYLENALDYPFGGGYLHATYGGYAHDLILDAYDEGGIFLVFPLIAIIVSMARDSLKFFRIKETNFENNLIVFCVLIAISCEFFVEPILAGMPWLLTSFAIIHGCISANNITSLRNKGLNETKEFNRR